MSTFELLPFTGKSYTYIIIPYIYIYIWMYICNHCYHISSSNFRANLHSILLFCLPRHFHISCILLHRLFRTHIARSDLRQTTVNGKLYVVEITYTFICKDERQMHSHQSGTTSTLQWRHNGLYSVSNHKPHHCLLNRLFKAQVKENIKAQRHWPYGDRWIPRTNGQ